MDFRVNEHFDEIMFDVFTVSYLCHTLFATPKGRYGEVTLWG
jgi:hypothetical protein